MLTENIRVMFIRFYIQNYLSKARSSSPPKLSENVWESGKASAKDVGQEVNEAMSSELGDRDPEPNDVPSEITYHTYRFNEGSENFIEKAEDVINHANDVVQEKVQDATDAMSEKVNQMNKRIKGPKDDTAEPKEAQNDYIESEASSSDEAFKNGIDEPPKLRPSSFSGYQRSQNRSMSPQKKTQLPRPSKSHSRKASPEKKDSSSKEEKKNNSAPIEEEKPRVNGEGSAEHEPKDEAKENSKEDDKEEEDKPSSLDESAYEVNPDELENEEEKKAEAEFQPKLIDAD